MFVPRADAVDEGARLRRQIVTEQSAMSVLQAEWARVADPSRIQHLAQQQLGLTDQPTAELSSLELLPRRGQAAPLDGARMRNASVTLPVGRDDPRIRLASVHPGN